jgi:hypothetical protein
MPDNGMEDKEELQEEARELPIREALTLLEGKPYKPVKITLVRRMDAFNQWLSSEKSVFAAKTAAAASVFATLSTPIILVLEIYRINSQSSRTLRSNGSSTIT